jgi:glycerol uptake facilitator-like aquaporin
LAALLQTGIAFSLGIRLAITICAGTSGGHFNPCITVSFVIMRGFPRSRLSGMKLSLGIQNGLMRHELVRYIACLLVYAQWEDQISVYEKNYFVALT